MANKTQTIRIESIMGGHSAMTHFSAPDQFWSSYGIDPSSPIQGQFEITKQPYGIKASGLIRPVISYISGGDSVIAPIWMTGVTGSSLTYVYGLSGSAYTVSDDGTTVTALSDAGTLSAGTAGSEGLAYYNNYLYFATKTDVTRYGPLDGSAGWVANYWTGVLGKPALTSVTYPYHATGTGSSAIQLPKHFMHRHSDGKLYISDVVDNRGTIHFISTKKTTVEGDTNEDSTYDKMRFGYGLVPTCMESYGDSLVIALFERASNSNSSNFSLRTPTGRAKVAFWDTTSNNVNTITWVEHPDGIITAIKNLNGVIYIFSTATEKGSGYRVMRYIGGSSFEEVYYSEDGYSPWPGAVDASGSRIIFGSQVASPETRGCIVSLGLQKTGLSSGIFVPYAVPTASACSVFCLMLRGLGKNSSALNYDYPIFGYSDTFSVNGIGNMFGGSAGDNKCMWWSQMYKIGQPFKITKIRIHLAYIDSIGSTTIVPKVRTDDGSGTTTTLPTINSTNYPNKRDIVYRPTNLTAENNFWIELTFTGSGISPVGLPIIIEYELIDD